jgi:L,D-transpeptidase YcbB
MKAAINATTMPWSPIKIARSGGRAASPARLLALCLLLSPACSDGLGKGSNAAAAAENGLTDAQDKAYAGALEQHMAQTAASVLTPRDSLDFALLSQAIRARDYRAMLPAASDRQRVEELLCAAAAYGLNAEHYAVRPFPGQADSLQALVWTEWELLAGLLRFARDAGSRQTDPADSLWQERRRMQLRDVLEAASDSLALRRALLAVQPAHPPYRALQEASARFVRSFTLEDSSAQVPLQRSDSLLAHTKARDLLLWRGFLSADSAASDSAYLRALRHFQSMHGLQPDGKIGALTAKALGQSNRSRWRSLATAMDRWRAEPEWTQPFALVNIPAFELRLYDGDTLRAMHRVVVGTRATPTPVHSSRIHTLVAYPYWNVPYSIATGEILPKAKQDSTYLSRNQYRVLSRSGQVLDAGSVPWSELSAGNFPYLIRQEGGTGNALGLVKFLFQNPYSVYLHDTNARNLFSRESRAFSHGCIRVERPMEVAAYLLERSVLPGDMDQVEQSIREKRERFIRLDPGLDIHLRYFTASAEADGWPVFHADVYGWDAAYRTGSE